MCADDDHDDDHDVSRLDDDIRVFRLPRTLAFLKKLSCRMRTSVKFILRKLTAVVLPGRGKVKQSYIKETLKLTRVSCQEKDWTKRDCLMLLRAVFQQNPELARIPVDLRARLGSDCDGGDSVSIMSCHV